MVLMLMTKLLVFLNKLKTNQEGCGMAQDDLIHLEASDRTGLGGAICTIGKLYLFFFETKVSLRQSYLALTEYRTRNPSIFCVS